MIDWLHRNVIGGGEIGQPEANPSLRSRFDGLIRQIVVSQAPDPF